MRQNVCFIKKLTHVTSGEEINVGFVKNCTYVESMDLTGPKLILTLNDFQHEISQKVALKELDELKISFSDDWREEGENIADSYIILAIKRMQGDLVKISALNKPLYKLKQIADKTKVFSMKGISDIFTFFSYGLTVDITSRFAIVENYHLIAGERPTTLLKQIAQEQGAEAWITRGKLHMQKFSDLYSQQGKYKFESNRMDCGYPIIDYSVPTGQLQLQEEKVRSFTGWNAEKGRVKTSSNNPILQGTKNVPVSMDGNPNPYTLGTATTAIKPVIAFTTLGNLTVEAGMPFSMAWHEADPEKPLNENMPDKAVVNRVGHWFEGNKFYTKIEGAIPFESQQVLY